MDEFPKDARPVFSGIQAWDEIAGKYMRGATAVLRAVDGFPVAEAARCLAWRFARRGERVSLLCGAGDVDVAAAALDAAGPAAGGGSIRALAVTDHASAPDSTVVVVEPGAVAGDEAARRFLLAFRRDHPRGLSATALLVASARGPAERTTRHEFDLCFAVVDGFVAGGYGLASEKNRRGVHDYWALPPWFPGAPSRWSGGGAP